MKQYKNQILNVAQWFVIGLIILVWIRFWLKDEPTITLDRSSTIPSTTPQLSTTNTRSIADYHLFGSAQQLYDLPSQHSQSSLDFTLNGTMSKTDVKSGMAYISNAKGVQQKFIVGDKVFDVATLKEVHKTFVVLQHNGKNERLSLPEQNRASQAAPKLNQNSKNNAQFAKHLGGTTKPSANWNEMIQQQKFDPANIKKIVENSNIVVDQGGKIRGVRVSNLSNGNVLTKLGLKSNDIITAVNGNQVTESNIMTIQQTLTTNPNATLTIKRDGKVQNIQVDIGNI